MAYRRAAASLYRQLALPRARASKHAMKAASEKAAAIGGIAAAGGGMLLATRRRQRGMASAIRRRRRNHWHRSGVIMAKISPVLLLTRYRASLAPYHIIYRARISMYRVA